MKRYRSILTRKLSQASSVYEVKHIAYLEYIPGAHTILCPLSAGISTFAVCFALCSVCTAPEQFNFDLDTKIIYSCSLLTLEVLCSTLNKNRTPHTYYNIK